MIKRLKWLWYCLKELIKYPKAYWKIPFGQYCDSCPFWDRIIEAPIQANGYCHFLNESDESIDAKRTCWRDGKTGRFCKKPEWFCSSLLWDKCKECNIKLLDFDDFKYFN
jgi:hypothetical protein